MKVFPTLHEVHEKVKLVQAPNTRHQQRTETRDAQVNRRDTTKAFRAPARVITNNMRIVRKVLNEADAVQLVKQKDNYVKNDPNMLETQTNESTRTKVVTLPAK